ncbi:PH domain-containing protein, partial [Aeromonas veronii]
YYRLEGDTLFVSSGPIRLCVPLREIVNITPTNNPLSSPALSLDRLRIEYGRGKSVMISPRNKEEFVRNLEAARRSVV